MPEQKTKRPVGWWYPWIFVASFAVIITVNGIMAYFATNSWTGLETQNAFKEGQQFNDQLAQKSAQYKLAWQVKIEFNAKANEASAISIKLTDKAGKAISNANINAIAVRPTHEGFDQVLTFSGNGDGRYLSPVTLPLAGQWEIRMIATRGNDLYKARHRFQVSK